MASMVDLADDFRVSGPTHMISSPMMINWASEEHRRCIAACLVKGTYVVEKDRIRCRLHTKALAPAWWESFHFRLKEPLFEETVEYDRFVFGAIYEHAPPAGAPCHPSTPRYIVAFRGTMLLHPRPFKDLQLDVKIMVNTLSKCRRSLLARRAVKKLLDTIPKRDGGGAAVCWLTGHSLGASLALDIGRTMMKEQGLNLPTFLFNPPHVSLEPVFNLLHLSEDAKRDLVVAMYHFKAGLGLLMRNHRKHMAKLFEQLSPWVPELYVHQRDVICQGFINYFEQREQAKEFFRSVAKAGMTLSYRDMISYLLSKGTEQPHLLPSATLRKNSSDDGYVHGLSQWWKPDAQLTLRATRYTYPGE